MKIKQRVATVLKRIIDAEREYKRQPGSVRLLAVSKEKTAAQVQEAFQCGLTDFGENYLQQALEKIQALVQNPIHWHFIGTIQRNKTKLIAENFSWVHSVDRKLIAQRLNDERPPTLPPLNICIQLNLDDEPQKGGISAQQLADLAGEISKMSRLRLRGLMVIPKYQPHFAEQYASFSKAFSVYQELKNAGFSLDTLSMGMSKDLEAAIAAGATMVRVGTDLFGPRA